MVLESPRTEDHRVRLWPRSGPKARFDARIDFILGFYHLYFPAAQAAFNGRRVYKSWTFLLTQNESQNEETAGSGGTGQEENDET